MLTQSQADGALAGPIVALACLGLLAALLLAISIGDVRRRQIPNRLCGAVALLALPYWMAATPVPPGPLLTQIILALAIGALLVIPFTFGVLGGGDVKLLAALMLWIRPSEVQVVLTITVLSGGALALVLIASARLRRRPVVSVPYGVAIAVGVLPILLGRVALFIHLV